MFILRLLFLSVCCRTADWLREKGSTEMSLGNTGLNKIKYVLKAIIKLRKTFTMLMCVVVRQKVVRGIKNLLSF